MKYAAFIASILLFPTLSAQTQVTISTGPSNTLQTFYSLQSGVQGAAPLAEWDLAFEITGFSSSILVNTAKGMIVYQASTSLSDWDAVNAPDTDNWILLHNSESDWSSGALTYGNNLSEPDGFNVGWGLYNIITHTIAGNKIYVIDDGQGNFRKLRINSLQTGTYAFTYADLDGSNEHQGTVNKTAFAQRNFAYWSMDTHTVMDREPITGTWDLLFTKYIGFIPEAYALTGVLQNKNIEALEVDGVPTDDADPWGAPFSTEINTIGADWKMFNMTTFQYEYADDRTYFVKDQQGAIWKLIFTGYGGSANGDITFTQELFSATTIPENALIGSVSAFPNPVTDGRLNLVVDGLDGPFALTVYDAQGRSVLREGPLTLMGVTMHSMDVGMFPSGVYTVQLQGDRALAMTRFVVQ